MTITAESHISNIKELDDFTVEPDTSFEKKELKTKTLELKILRVLWDKVKDTIGVDFQVPDHPTIKRGMLKFLASIYDPVGIISPPIMLLAKDMYREECNLKLSWDQRLLEDLTK